MPKQPRFQSTGKGSFFGDYVYRQVVGPGHFLATLQQVIDWEALGAQLLQAYKGEGAGGVRPTTRCCCSRCCSSVTSTASQSGKWRIWATYHLAVKHFLRLAIDEPAPDHSTPAQVQRELLEHQGQDMLRGYSRGCCSRHETMAGDGTLQVLDSVHSQADVNLDKDRDRQDDGQSPCDPDAQVLNAPGAADWPRKAVQETPGRRGQQEFIPRAAATPCKASTPASGRDMPLSVPVIPHTRNKHGLHE
jgi:hypothetical protein